MLDESFLDGVVLGHLRGEIFLTLEDRGDVALELDDFASDGEGGLGADQTAGEGAEKNGAGEEKDVTGTHEKASRVRMTMG